MWKLLGGAIGGCLLLAAGVSAQRSNRGATQPPAPQPTISQACANAIDYVDATYGGRIRNLKKADSHEHNIYSHRNPWNAENTYMVGIRSDLDQKNWRVVLYDSGGCFLKELFTIDKYDWRLAWDRNAPEILYTWKSAELYSYNVRTGNAKLLKSFAPLRLGVNGPSLNQDGDRILVITSDGAFRTYRLPDMQDERTFRVTFPAGCDSVWRDERYIGHRNFIVTGCNSKDLTKKVTYIYDDRGVIQHRFDGFTFGHTDFSPDGQWAYGKLPSGPHGGPRARAPLEVHVVNIDGTNDRVVYSVPSGQAAYVHNLHVSWPDRVSTWFIVSFYPSARHLPPTYAPPLDEIIKINTDGSYRFLARTYTADSPALFWAEPLASPSSDGSRVSFNSNRGGSINQYILWVPPDALQGMTR